MNTTQGLTSNQIKRLELIRNSIINIQDSPEFAKMDYYPDLTLGDSVQAIEELIIECERDKPVKTIKWTVSRRFTLINFLTKGMLTSFFVCGFFACGALFSNGLNEINRTRFSVADMVDWESLGEVATGVSMAALAVSAGCALTAVAINQKEK
ncbi:hypothetical protein [Brasilonema sp. UFV-L1]|uniref:hypothetical protein n=1 Tax=Brasilonema sp. UFV-L1 TaxID=2234130 RepID=UPI00145CAA92|nr:hypothetical protein [Brasilonema sp. UFV-L1]NMG11939.1 hypothetical protein [Brasilonema sp. UFV-L1]